MAKKKLSPKQMKNTKGGAAEASVGRLGKVVASKPNADILATDTITTAEAIMRRR